MICLSPVIIFKRIMLYFIRRVWIVIKVVGMAV